ncbi:MAG: SAP domain-containing protein [Thermoflexales bacterium]|nr:SAP domain-containing protein [Thermoflexales bacterium]
MSFYWLKEELVGFCREHGLSTAGSKQSLSARIRLFLETGQPPVEIEHTSATRIARRANMPRTFTRQSAIEPGWRCSQELRAFLEQEIGASFHFDGVMRDFIHHGAGKTLHEAIVAWEAEQNKPERKQEIAPQFEYNRHIREYFSLHPGATLAEAIQAWNAKKSRRSGSESNPPASE